MQCGDGDFGDESSMHLLLGFSVTYVMDDGKASD